MLRHGKSEGRFRLLHGHLEASFRGGEEVGIPLAQPVQAFLDRLEARLPAVSLREELREEVARIPLTFRHGQAAEAALRQEVPHDGGLRFRDEDREEPGGRERFVVQGHGIETFDFPCNLSDEYFQRVVPAVVREREWQQRERTEFVDFAVEVLQERLGLLFRCVLF